jgi:hypothetical protein
MNAPSLSLVRALVYGAIGLSLAASFATIVVAMLAARRGRRERWPSAMAIPFALAFTAGWIWLPLAFQIGAIIGWNLGSEIGRSLPPVADAALMSALIGLFAYLLFAAPVSLLAALSSLGVTTRRKLSCRAKPSSSNPSLAAH